MHKIWNVRNLTVLILIRLFYGGYTMGMDQYHFNDISSAQTVFVRYLLLGLFFTIYLFRKKIGLIALIVLEVIFLSLNIGFTVLAITNVIDPGLHDPMSDVGLTLLQIVLPLLTFILSIKILRSDNGVTS